MNPLKGLESCGQSPWLDYLKTSLVTSGELARMISEDGLKGLTSNPSIFQKGIGESSEYDEALTSALSKGPISVSALYQSLAVSDIQAAADAFRGVYERTGGVDGYVSLECSPYVADDTQGTIAEALRLWEAVGRDNLMIKVPGTPAGVPAVRDLISRGLNVNVTLLFSLSAYETVAEAYIAGLEALKASGGDLSRPASVASFFVSRIDSAVDKRLEALGGEAALSLKGRIAIANAKTAYARYKALFSGPRWEALAAAGARPQRLLWASTSVKDKSLKDTLYVEALIGRDTVDTLPPATLEAFRDHGELRADAVEADLDGARETLERLSRLGISLDEITDELVVDGVRQFADAFDSLLGSVARRRLKALEGEADRQVLEVRDPDLASALDAAVDLWRREGRARRLWRSDASLWTGADEAKWTGWLHAPERESADLETLVRFGDEIRDAGFRDVLLLGMGGSSLGPEVLAEALGPQPGRPRFHMLDSTDPDEVRAREAELELARTLFIVSSKSGGTLEPNLFLDYFWDRARAVRGGAPGEAFVAVTDPGSSLERRARELGFRRIFHGVPEIGGRYSVLSKFGLVPAAALGLDVARLLASARAGAQASGEDAPPAENPGVRLGLLLGTAAARFGRDKVTIFAGPALSSLPAWLEQLLAESTGKTGKGLIPVAGEPIGAPGVYGPDRLFVDLSLQGEVDPERERALAALAAAGHPLVRLKLRAPYDIPEEFFRWETATAVAGAVIGINPFDQPDVEASKVKTRELMEGGGTSDGAPAIRDGGLSLFADAAMLEALGSPRDLRSALAAHFASARAPDYVAFLAYLERRPDHEALLTQARAEVRDARGCATCLGFGPRFQHSTGQAYKGGPPTGVFVQITATPSADLPVPGRAYGFAEVEAAQAAGDLSVLRERGRRALRVHLDEAETGLRRLVEIVRSALG